MKHVIRKFCQCVAFCLLGMVLCQVFTHEKASAQGVVIIGNTGVPDSTLKPDDLKDIYLNKRTKWSDGKRIVFVTLKDSDTHQDFLRQHIQRTSSQFRNFWKQQVFTGKGKMPPVFESEKDLLEFVSRTDGAVGYVSTGIRAGDVKIFIVQ